MGRFNVRFFGRFVFAEPVVGDEKGTGELKVLAVNMQYNNDVSADGHEFVVTADRAHVSVPGTRRPDVMLMTSASPATAELCMWDLRDYQVTIEGNNTFEWYQRGDNEKADEGSHGKEMLADLTQLTGGEGRFNKLNLSTTGLFSPVHAVVNVSGGIGTTSQMANGETIDFVKFTREPTEIKSVQRADVVEILIDEADTNTLTFHLQNRNGGPASSIVVTANDDADRDGSIRPTVVSFSNLCSTPHREYDQEFAGFYEVLENPPLLRERLIPRRPAEEGWQFDCFKPVYIAYRVG